MNRCSANYLTTATTATSRGISPTAPLSTSIINFSHRHQCTTTTSTSTSTTLQAHPATIARYGINSHYLVRILFLRCLAFVYSTAFLIAYRQNKALIGDKGMTPARDILDAAERRGKAKQDTRLQKQQQPRSSRSTTRLWRTTNSLLHTVREILWDRTDASNRPLPTILWTLSPSQRQSNLNPSLDKIALTGLALSLSS